MRTYLKSLSLGSTLFALVAVAIATTVILTDLQHRSYPQLMKTSPAIQTGNSAALNVLGGLVGRRS
ncbi:MAG: hypothetical protein ACREX9_24285 [Gammaproteobacteria bacterium]